MSQFHLPSGTSTSAASTTQTASPTLSSFPDSEEEEDTLPYPTELPRSDFLAPGFSPQTYLSSLRNRHQALEDLRQDLRQRSQFLNRELLDLVNGNYEEFLSLGSDLKGGEEKVESVRVGVLGFQREVDGLRQVVRGRQAEMGRLLEEKGAVRNEVALGRALLELCERLSEMEAVLGISEKEDLDEDNELEEEEEEGEDEDSSVTTSPQLRRPQDHIQQFLFVANMIERIGTFHPFLQAQQPRVDELRKTLLLDLATAMRQAKHGKATDDLLAIVRLYGDLDAEVDSVRVLKGG